MCVVRIEMKICVCESEVICVVQELLRQTLLYLLSMQLTESLKLGLMPVDRLANTPCLPDLSVTVCFS